MLTPVVRRNIEGGKLVPTHGDYPDAVRELALESGVSPIDMTGLSGQLVDGLGEQEGKALYVHLVGAGGPAEDNTHFFERGAYAMAALVARQLDRLRIVTRSIAMMEFIRVEQDGSGDFARVQDAVNSLDGSVGPVVIMIGAGDYGENFF